MPARRRRRGAVQQQKFAVGDRVSVLYEKKWYDASVINVAKTNVQIKYDSDDTREKIFSVDQSTRIRRRGGFTDPRRSAGQCIGTRLFSDKASGTERREFCIVSDGGSEKRWHSIDGLC